MTKGKMLLATATALMIGGFASVASAAPASVPLADAGAALKVVGEGAIKQNVLFFGHRRGGYWGGPRVYSYYYGPRRWHHRRHWRGGGRHW